MEELYQAIEDKIKASGYRIVLIMIHAIQDLFMKLFLIYMFIGYRI